MPKERCPAAFVELMKHAVEILDSDDPDERSFDTDDGSQSEEGFVGRSDKGFTFVFFPKARKERWTVLLTEEQMRAIADGSEMWIDVQSEPHKPGAKKKKETLTVAPTAKRLLEALLSRELIALQTNARLGDVAEVLERLTFDAIDDHALSEEERGEQIIEALVEMPSVEDVFGEPGDVMSALRTVVPA
jgi:hypothetical protein